MPTLSGFHVQALSTWTAYPPWGYTQNLATPGERPTALGGLVKKLAVIDLGNRTFTLPVSPVRFDPGVAFPSFLGDFYGRVHILPPGIALGNLLSTQTRTVEVWNGHLADKLLSGIAGTGTDGITMTPPPGKSPPNTYRALESVVFTLLISNIGAPKIDAKYLFYFPSETPTLTITGSRITVWRFRPNWARALTERWAWLTDVLTSFDGTEQRIRLRGIPRREFEFEVLAAGVDRQCLENALWAWQHRVFAVPVWVDRRALTVAAPPGGESLIFDTGGTEFEAGSLVVLMSAPSGVEGNATQRLEAQEILGVTQGGLALKLPLQNGWPIGTGVYPARLGRIGASQRLERLTDGVTQLVVNFRLEDAGDWLQAEDSTGTYRGLPVLEDKPNWAGDLEAEVVHKITEYDHQTGPVWVEYEGLIPSRIEQFRWLLASRSEVDRLRRWLYARSGRLAPFWVPSHTSDFTVTTPVAQFETRLVVAHSGYASLVAQSLARRDVRIRLRDGSVFHRRIVASRELSSAEEEIQLDGTLGVALNPQDIVMISFLSLCRLDQDRIELAWHTDQIIECALSVRTLNDDV